ncbi:hypothetical protein TBLA_0F00230 [Henningerozyma blattae CBS 6284]|uniref:DNA mismatch repair protein MSH3 n=1 Tax=Henningerozyma blattae (strain ATCC 34711 / CBS 6284 / DSM 70876 / NBRC 10599 / NRRL Y-10934 / UCD 77-7) TaxID=1071380 RepID=I2H5B5_HENB6|nr:hypothetical protein TBLA_0F00230 [Tetrapisispora blattae CBS 6284]CCH61567.1 hypothetical protein TBLA_0F00230 [Tetrapisispora blattae CBS 6284]
MSQQPTISKFFKSVKKSNQIISNAKAVRKIEKSTTPSLNVEVIDDEEDEDYTQEKKGFNDDIPKNEVSKSVPIIEDLTNNNCHNIDITEVSGGKLENSNESTSVKNKDDHGTIFNSEIDNKNRKKGTSGSKNLLHSKKREKCSIVIEENPNKKFKLDAPIYKRKSKLSTSAIILNDKSDTYSLATVKSTAKLTAKLTATSKLTPLDQQVKDLKINNMDKVLVIRVGYKYKCFAEDAVKVSNILHIMLVPGKLTIDESNPKDSEHKQYAYCSFPDTRLNVHLERLVRNNLKVGVVEQFETTAIKKLSSTSNKSSVFERRIANTYSKATFGINTPFKCEGKHVIGNLNSIWCISIENISNTLNNYKLFSVNLNSGEIIYDTFEEFPKNPQQLLTRIKYLQPVEIITLKGSLDIKLFEKDTITIINKSEDEYNSIIPNEKLDTFLVENKIEEKTIENSSVILQFLYDYLQQYNNQDILLIKDNYKSFVSTQHMLLSSKTIDTLDIFSNNGSKGSLYWILDHTRTPFGSRTLLDWISRPLLNAEEINDRLDAVECMKNIISQHFFESIGNLLKGMPDLLRALNRIAYGSISKKELYFFLKQFNMLEELLDLHSDFIEREILSSTNSIKSDMIRNIFISINLRIKETSISNLLSMINVSSVLDKSVEKQTLEFFNLNNYDNPDKIIQRQRDIEGIKSELDEELKIIRKQLKRPHLNYKDEKDYLIEVRNSQVKGLPSDWIKISSTKMVGRFQTPNVTKLLERLQYQKDMLQLDCEQEYSRFVDIINKKYPLLRDIINNLGVYDCILALAAVSCNVNYTRPIINDKYQHIIGKNSRNPIVESLDIKYVPNDINITSTNAINIITGPNMGGKSTYIRQVALLVILAQVGSYVPADFLELSIFDNISTRIGAYDDLIRGESTFMIELNEIKEILDTYSSKSLLLLDEVGRGTSTIDGKAISSSLIKYFIETQDCPLIFFTTHYPVQDISSSTIKNYFMDYIEEMKPGETWRSITFLYKLKNGISEGSFGLNVAKLAQINEKILTKAQELSVSMKTTYELNSDLELLMALKRILHQDRLSASEKFSHLLDIDNSDDI